MRFDYNINMRGGSTYSIVDGVGAYFNEISNFRDYESARLALGNLKADYSNANKDLFIVEKTGGAKLVSAYTTPLIYEYEVVFKWNSSNRQWVYQNDYSIQDSIRVYVRDNVRDNTLYCSSNELHFYINAYILDAKGMIASSLAHRCIDLLQKDGNFRIMKIEHMLDFLRKALKAEIRVQF